MSKTKTKLVVGGVPEHFNLPWHLAMESGQFESSGIEIEYHEMYGGTGQMTRGLRDSSLDLAVLLTEGGIADILNGNPSSIIKTYVESPLIWGIHVASDSKIESVDQVEGSVYAISRSGSGSHLMAIVDASERGWETDELAFEKVGTLDGARQALKNGTADTFFWERFTTAPYVDNGEFRRVGERRTLWPAFVICARNETIENRSAAILETLRIVDGFCESLMARDDACQEISKRYELKLDQVRLWFEQTSWSLGFSKPNDAIEKAKQYLVKLQLVTQQSADEIEVWRDLT